MEIQTPFFIQKDKNEKVISIVILDYNLITDSTDYHNKYYLYDKITNSKFIELLEIHTLELKKLPQISDHTQLFDWLSFIKAEKEEDYKMIIEKNPEVKKAYVIVKELSKNEQTKLLEESIEKQRKDEASRIKGAYRKGIEQGIEQGEKSKMIQIIKNAHDKKYSRTTANV